MLCLYLSLLRSLHVPLSEDIATLSARSLSLLLCLSLGLSCSLSCSLHGHASALSLLLCLSLLLSCSLHFPLLSPLLSPLTSPHLSPLCVLLYPSDYQDAWDAGLTGGAYIARADGAGTLVVDGETDDSTGRSPGRYVNHSKLWCNCAIVGLEVPAPWSPNGKQLASGAVYVVTRKEVTAGSEFLVDYGDAYWEFELRRKKGEAPAGLPPLLRRIAIDYLP